MKAWNWKVLELMSAELRFTLPTGACTIPAWKGGWQEGREAELSGKLKENKLIRFVLFRRERGLPT